MTIDCTKWRVARRYALISIFLGRKHEINPMSGCHSNPRQTATPSAQRASSHYTFRIGAVKWKGKHWWRKREPVRNADLCMELDEWPHCTRQPAYGPGATPAKKTTPGATRCHGLAQNASAAERSSWADGRPHAPLRLGLGVDYVPPKPQADLFEDVEPGGEDDDDDQDAVQKIGCFHRVATGPPDQLSTPPRSTPHSPHSGFLWNSPVAGIRI